MGKSHYKGKIWIDLDNAPHVPFFAPIRRELQERGYEVWVTASERHQVTELASMHGIPHLLFKGGYYGRNKILKTLGIFQRGAAMYQALPAHHPDLALSHGSRSQIMAAKLRGVPVVLIMDYEHAQFPFLRPNCLIVPDVVPDSALFYSCAVLKYSGLKEDVYAAGFHPTGGLLDELGISPRKIIATVRPPATDAHYHNSGSEILFAHVVRHISADDRAVMVMLPRNNSQARNIREKWGGLIEQQKMVIPERSVPGLELIWESDLVVSGGGTMNREAATLEVPVYSIFRGKIGAVDRHLSATGRLTLLQNVDDVDRLVEIAKRDRTRTHAARPHTAVQEIVKHIESVLQERRLLQPLPI